MSLLLKPSVVFKLRRRQRKGNLNIAFLSLSQSDIVLVRANRDRSNDADLLHAYGERRSRSGRRGSRAITDVCAVCEAESTHVERSYSDPYKVIRE